MRLLCRPRLAGQRPRAAELRRAGRGPRRRPRTAARAPAAPAPRRGPAAADPHPPAATSPALTAELVRQGLLDAGPGANDLYDRVVGRVESELIQQVLASCDRVQIKAAARLGINRNTLHKKLTEYGIDTNGDGTPAPADPDEE